MAFLLLISWFQSPLVRPTSTAKNLLMNVRVAAETLDLLSVVYVRVCVCVIVRAHACAHERVF